MNLVSSRRHFSDGWRTHRLQRPCIGRQACTSEQRPLLPAATSPRRGYELAGAFAGQSCLKSAGRRLTVRNCIAVSAQSTSPAGSPRLAPHAHHYLKPAPERKLDLLASTIDVTTSTIDSDSETCAFTDGSSGDVQMVCDSDPAHPISLAEAAVYRPVVSPRLLQEVEQRLEADIATIFVTLVFAVGFVSLEFGVTDLFDHLFGESVLSGVLSAVGGLMLVMLARLSKVPLLRLDRWH